MCDVEGRVVDGVTCFMRRELSDGCGCWLLWLVECGEKALSERRERDAARVTDVADCWRRERERERRVL